jgi:integral membrane protein (TIGR01906 family)
VVAILLAGRIVMNPWFVEFEYRTPGFPADPYGFTLDERLKYSKIAIAYLLNDADISFLAEQRFPLGQAAPPESCVQMDDCTRMYNPRELKHMEDVKITVRGAWLVLSVGLALLLLSGVAAWRGGWLAQYRRGLARGGWLTLILIGLIFALTLLLFNWLFVFFHQMFFAEGTWMFLFSDTLIRMFPERFWRDTFIIVGVFTASLGLLFTSLGGGRMKA